MFFTRKGIVMARGNPGVPKSPEHRAKISAALSGRRLSEQHRDNLAAENNYAWKGEAASYSVIHQVLRRRYPKSGTCSTCTRAGGKTEYAFLKHPAPHTRNITDYVELCPPCHRRMDTK